MILNVLEFGGLFEGGYSVFYWLLKIVCFDFRYCSVLELFFSVVCSVGVGWMELKIVCKVCVFLLINNCVSFVLFVFFLDVLRIVDIVNLELRVLFLILI